MVRSSNYSETLVLVGAACRFPGPAYSLEEFRRLLNSGVDAVTSVPQDRFDLDRFFSAAQNFAGRAITSAAGVLPDLLHFDSDFFGISRTEALTMDPQQRLVLEMTWEAFENAGIRPSSLRGSGTGVYMGAAGTDTALRNTDDPAAGTAYTMTGSTLSIVSNRVSYLFDFHGPSLSIDTACSSSLVALHLACEALRNGETPLAVVGAVNCLFSPYPFSGFSKARMLSPDGRCKTFDASGNGYVRSEGGGVVLATTLAHAQKNGWEVLAVIAGTGVNSDGRTTGISLPNPEAQGALIRQVYDRFNLDRRKLVYVEAHGTGTAVGDPLEASAIGNELGKHLTGVRTLPVGSVKSNIGHLETSAGMAGLLKALIVLRHGEIPPNLHFETPNPAIDFDGANIRIPTERMRLPEAGGGELVSVNSFGFGGTNAHVVLRKPEPAKARRGFSRTDNAPPFLLSARSRFSLRALARRYAELLEGADEKTRRDLAYGLAFKRDQLELRAAFTGAKAADVRDALLAAADSDKTGDVKSIREPDGKQRSGVFVFSGNGSQWSGMGRGLYADDSVFCDALDKTDAILTKLQGWSVVDVLRNPEKHPDAFSRTEMSQPLIFAIQVGLVESLGARGIQPAAVIGHSVGEVAAAWCAGALSLEDAALVIHVRSKLQAPLHGSGAMAAANMTEAQAREMLKAFDGAVDVAAINADASVSLAGEVEALKAVVALCKKRRIAAKMLPVPYPFHTRFMEAIDEDLGDALADITPLKPRLPFFSTVWGKSVRTFKPDAAYWRGNVRNPVLFASAVKAAHGKGFRLFLEIGPSPVLRSYIRDTLRNAAEQIFIGVTLTKGGNEPADFDAAWKTAWRHGWKLDLERLFPGVAADVALPAYPWNKEYCWRDPSPECRGYLDAGRVHPLLGWRLPGKAAVFENEIHPADLPWLEDHVVGSQTTYPAAAFLESMLAAGRSLFPEQGAALERVVLFRPLVFAADAAKSLRLSVDMEDGGLSLDARAHNSAEDWGSYARARIVPAAAAENDDAFSWGAPERFGVAVEKDSLYAMTERAHLHYGPAFRVIRKVWLKTDPRFPEALAKLTTPPEGAFDGMCIPPTLLDGAFHTLFLLLGARASGNGQAAYLPAAFDRATLINAGVPRYAHARLEKISARSIVASFRLLDAEGRLLLVLRGCRFRRAAWVEHENAPSKAYTPMFFPVPHPRAVGAPANFSLDLLKKAARKALPESEGVESKNSPHSWLLLQFASLAAARESVLATLGQGDQHKSFSCEELLASGKLSAVQEPWFRWMLERLEAADFALRENGSWRIPPQDKRRNAGILWRTALATAPEQACEAALLSHVAADSHAVLRGEFDEKEHGLLPTALLQSYYGNATSLASYAEAARKAVLAALRKTGQGEELRVLLFAKEPEAFIAPLAATLKTVQCRLAVAAEGAAAADAGNERFSRIPGVRFTPLSFEGAGEEHEGRHHLILVNWTLHENVNIGLALEQCRKMLAPGGVLLVTEQPPNPFADYVFGSQSSWWRASAQQDRPASLLQSRAVWEQELRQASFADVEGIGDDHTPAFLLFARKSEELELEENSVSATVLSDQAPESVAREPVARRWLIVGRKRKTASAHLAERLYKSLQKEGEEAVLLLRGDEFSGFRFNPENPEHWQILAAECGDRERSCVVYLAGYDNQAEIGAKELETIQTRGTSGLAALAQAWGAFTAGSELWIVAGGASSGGLPGERPIPSQGALLGFARVLRNELRSAQVRFLDAHGDAVAAFAPALLQELLFPCDEPEAAFAGKLRFVPRLEELKGERERTDTVDAPAGAALVFDQPGRLRNLYWAQSVPRLPGAGEVRVRVSHTGLNFRDVMWAMGLLPDEALENGFSGTGLGIECSGVVDAVGGGVTEWAVGDEVLCFAPSCFSSHVITPASAVAAKPSNISFAQAATIPVAFITAWYSLRHLARLERGQRVLIHGAAGGVGLAAIQIAAHMGLEVYATAGAPEKHHFLRRLGVTRLFSSRSLDFAPEIMKATDGQGVDCVLNSLSGEAAAAGVGLLRPFGHFIELGKRDFFADSPMRLRPFSNNLTYYGVDVDQLFIHKPELARSLFAELMELFAQRKLSPLPHAVYPADRAADAFQAMQQAAHIGKLVVGLDGAANVAQPEPSLDARWKADPDGVYLVSGGSSGLGLASAALLARRGAKYLMLLSRRGVVGKEEREIAASLRAAGTTIVDVAVDVTNAASLNDALRRELAALPPLRGVVHSAASLDDGMINSLTSDRIASSLSVKAMGAWNLHHATLGAPLDFFALFSSATTQFGNPGQAGYVAANCMLETLAAWRRKQGLPAQVIGWGPIGDTGMLTRNPKARQLLLQRLGISATASEDAMTWLEQCLVKDVPHSAYFGLNWQNRADLPVLASPRFSLLRPLQSDEAAEGGSVLEAIRGAAPAEGERLVADVLLAEAAHILRLPADKLSADDPLAGQGMDSLMAVELALAVEQKFELTGYAMPLTDKTTARQLAKSIYALIAGSDAEKEAQVDIVDQTLQKHGVSLSAALHEETLKTLSGGKT